MLDPVTAIGLASSIVAFVDFSAKLVKGSIEIYQASDGTLTENRNSQAVAGAMERFAARLVIQQPSQLFGEEKELVDLAKHCHVVCLELLNLLGRIKPKDLSSKRQSLWAALKNRFHEGERKELESRLDTYRRQLELHMSFKTMISVEKLFQYVAEHSESLNPLKATVSELSAISIDTHESIRQLLNTQKVVLHASITEQILKSLKHDDMDKRHGMIEDAHEKTFHWIFDIDGAARNNQAGSVSPAPDGWDSVDTLGSNVSDASVSSFRRQERARRRKWKRDRETEKTNEEIQMRQESREKFLTWLSAGTGIFHISGKMGCGKSTLMKFLSHHPGTRTRLDEWASGNQLVLASFFFWRPGSEDQKSLDGLYRSLLHSVLKHHHDLIPSIFPRAWREARETSWTTQAEVTLSGDDISKAFALLVRSENVCANYSFCFFVDGLDEYQIRTQADHMDLVERLHSWTTAFPSNVKLCVSSREEHPFMESFAEAQRLRLHTLTQYDIKAYILDRLPSSENPRFRQALAKYIVKKASGVFFWVALVVRNIRGQWYFKLKPAGLRNIVREFPSELNDLYRHILKKVDKYSRKMAYQTLAMIPFVTGWGSYIHLDLLAYSFLDEYNLNARFAREGKFKGKLSEEQKEERRQSAQTRLSGWCGGLVEFDSWGNIGYAHRSVADFLEADGIQEQISASLRGTHPVSILSELMLARWKVQGIDGNWRRGASPYDLMALREKHHLDQEPFEFLRSMDTIFEPELKRVDDSTLDGGIEVRIRGYAFNIASTQVKGELGITNVLGFNSNFRLSFAPLFFPYLETNDYVLWSIENDPRTTNTASKVVLLFYASILKPTYPVLDMLLELRIVDPQLRTDLMPDIGTFWWKETYISSAVGESHSIWQYFLVQEFYAWLDDKDYDVHRRFVGIVERFLRIGADHRFRFSILVVQWPTAAGIKPETEDTFTFGDPNEPETLSFKRKWLQTVNDRLETVKRAANAAGLDCTFSKLRTWPCEANGPRREISLTGWIRAMGDFPGKDDVLQLVEEREHNLQRVQNNQVVTVQSPLEDQSVDTLKTAGKTERDVTVCDEPTVLLEKRITLNWLYLTGIMLGVVLIALGYIGI